MYANINTAITYQRGDLSTWLYCCVEGIGSTNMIAYLTEQRSSSAQRRTFWHDGGFVARSCALAVSLVQRAGRHRPSVSFHQRMLQVERWRVFSVGACIAIFVAFCLRREQLAHLHCCEFMTSKR